MEKIIQAPHFPVASAAVSSKAVGLGFFHSLFTDAIIVWGICALIERVIQRKGFPYLA